MKETKKEHYVPQFFSLTWILGINKTAESFYTSDNPIGTKAHVKNPYIYLCQDLGAKG